MPNQEGVCFFFSSSSPACYTYFSCTPVLSKTKTQKGELTRRRPINVALASMSRKKSRLQRERERERAHTPCRFKCQTYCSTTGYTLMPQTLWVHKKPYIETNGSERSVPFSHVGPQFATPRELFPSHPNPVYPHLHQLLPQRTPPEYHCAKPSGTTRGKNYN